MARWYFGGALHGERLGKTVIDWGTAPADTSLGNFKRQWGAEPVDSYRYTYVQGAGTPDATEPAEQQPAAPDDSGPRGAMWDRIPVDALGVAATVAHRLM